MTGRFPALIAGLLLLVSCVAAHAQDDDDLEQCIVDAAALFNTYRECVSQVISYYAAKAKDPDVIITFAKQQCGADREDYVQILTKCMGKDIAQGMAEAEEAENLLPHLHRLLENAAKAKLHGDQTKPSAEDAFHAPMTFRLADASDADDAVVIAAEGSITEDTPDHFKQFITEHKIDVGKGRVRLNSPGGLVMPALTLGKAIRTLKLSTDVGAVESSRPQCSSSCVYVFLAGVYRSAEVGQIGVHRFYRDLALSDPGRKAYDSKDMADVQKVSAILLDYVNQMGGHSGIVSRAANTPEDTISYLTAEELVQLKVILPAPD